MKTAFAAPVAFTLLVAAILQTATARRAGAGNSHQTLESFQDNECQTRISPYSHTVDWPSGKRLIVNADSACSRYHGAPLILTHAELLIYSARGEKLATLYDQDAIISWSTKQILFGSKASVTADGQSQNLTGVVIDWSSCEMRSATGFYRRWCSRPPRR